MNNEIRQAVRDPALSATLLESKPLMYQAGASAELDRPAHVRAGSSLHAHGPALVLVQDDANFIALVQPATMQVDCFTLPAGQGQQRQFDDGRGNKKHKLDLEAAVLLPPALLLAFGSGSKRARETIALLDLDSPQTEPRLVHAPGLYAALRAQKAFSGSELNIEGAVLAGTAIRFFNRGNGATRAGIGPSNATIDVDARVLLHYLQDPAASAVPQLSNLRRYDLGALGGRALTFTDATVAGAVILFIAVAELSPDATRDGPVSGSVVGTIDGNTVRWAPICDAAGAIVPFKVEGIVIDAGDPARALIVADPDDADRPAELAALRLAGPWPHIPPA